MMSDKELSFRALKTSNFSLDNQTLEIISLKTAKKHPIRCRRIAYRDAATGKHYIFLSNNSKLSVKIITDP
jgi:hypothetical protein